VVAMDHEPKEAPMNTLVSELLTIREAADELGLKYMTMWKKVDRGQVPVYTVAGRKMIHRNDVAAMIVPPVREGDLD
jgi:excisionase family DNA binding protein